MFSNGIDMETCSMKKFRNIFIRRENRKTCKLEVVIIGEH